MLTILKRHQHLGNLVALQDSEVQLVNDSLIKESILESLCLIPPLNWL